MTHKQIDDYMFQVAYRVVATVTVSLPLAAFITCILWSLWFDFESSTATHCFFAKNVLPSISSAIGASYPQNYIWRICIALHAAPRFLTALMYRGYWTRILYPSLKNYILILVCCVLSFVENFSLLGLTYVSSREDYPIHEKCFITFMISSELYMLLTIYIMNNVQEKFLIGLHYQSLNVKKQLVAINMAFFAFAAYFFYRHNWYCENYIYTLFAFSEYIVVFTNMGYHITAYWDFYDKYIYVGSKLHES